MLRVMFIMMMWPSGAERSLDSMDQILEERKPKAAKPEQGEVILILISIWRSENALSLMVYLE